MHHKNWKCPQFMISAGIICVISSMFVVPSIDFNLKLISMIVLIFATYYMVIQFKTVGTLFVSFFYVAGFIAVAIVSRFSAYHTNAVMAFQVSTLISLYYLNAYVSKSDAASKKLYESSIIDDMTGIYNKRYFRLRAEEELARSERYSLRFAIVLIDINQFKRINDTHGHLVGDDLLKMLAHEIGLRIRKEDTFCRYGGDEFVVVVSNFEELSKTGITKRILESVESVNSKMHEKLICPITVSIGFGIFPDNAVDVAGLFQYADRAMYRVKNHNDDFAFSESSRKRRQQEQTI